MENNFAVVPVNQCKQTCLNGNKFLAVTFNQIFYDLSRHSNLREAIGTLLSRVSETYDP